MIAINTILFTKNYQLRIPNETDVDFVFSATRYTGFNNWMLWDAPDQKREIVEALERNIKGWKEGRDYNFTIETQEVVPTRLGRISIHKTEEKSVWSIGYWTHPRQQAKGIMTEALECIVEFGFRRLGAQRLQACYAIENKASEKVLIKNGFKFECHLEQGFKKKGQWIPENKMVLDYQSWRKTKTDTENCDFCKILTDNKNTIFENQHLVVLLDIDPISLGHVIICPKQHYADFHNLPDEVLLEMTVMAKRYILLLQKLFPAKGYSMMLNAGAFNDLKHCHLHVFPRNSATTFQWTYDENSLSQDARNFMVLKKLFEGHLEPT